jgi:hypothetical protein
MTEQQSPIDVLADLVRENFEQLFKGDPGFEEAIDAGFARGRKDPKSTLTAEEFVEAFNAAPHGYYGDAVTVETLKQGPSYTTLGGWIGDQGLAMAFMILGADLGLWDVVTPFSLGLSRDSEEDVAKAGEMMGLGFVMIAPKHGTALVPA